MSWIVAQTMVRQLVAPREGVDLIGALSHIALRDFRSHWWSECVDASSRVNAKNVNVFSSSSARLLTASPIAFAVLGFEAGQLSHRFRLRRLAPDAVQFRLHLASFSPGNGAQHIAPLMRLASVDEVWPKRVPRPQKASHHDLKSTMRSIWIAPRLRRSCEPRKPIHPCFPRHRLSLASTSLFPSRSTPKAVKIMVESALSP